MASSALDQEKGTGTGIDVHNRAASSEEHHKFETTHDAAARGHAATDMFVSPF